MINWKILTFLLLIVICVLIDKISTESYCQIKTCSPSSQTMCKYNSPTYSNLCGDRKYIKSRLTREEQFEVLRAHNYLRAFVASGKETRGSPGPQPQAINMRSLVWDPELATVAQKWADQCLFGHDQCRDVARFKVGQNVAYKSFSHEFPKNLTEIVVQWYNEVKDLNRNLVKKFQYTNAFILHYTQMIWAETTRLGCGCIRYKKNNYWYTTYLVCNYGPVGNMIGKSIYET